MPVQARDKAVSGSTVSPFRRDGVGDRIARLLVLEMVLWPGLLFAGGTLLAAWHARTHPTALAVLVVATCISVLVAVRQWRVMLRAVFPTRPALKNRGTSPRPTGRGGTNERAVHDNDRTMPPVP